jgi:UDP-N-acetylmuramoylalanine--D-glutamate ligase
MYMRRSVRGDMIGGMQEVRNKRVTVAGLGRFGGQIAAARWLVEQGAKVLVTDKSPAETLGDSIKQLDGLPIEFRLGEHREEDFASADLVVSSPAIPPKNEFLRKAVESGVPVTTEIELFIERCPAVILGVTGTKGKSTASALLGEMLRTRFTTWVGGNIGRSLLFDLPKMSHTDMVVLELSSYMLEHLRNLRWSPHVAVVTMLSVDHIEWHGSVEAYIDAKKNIVRFQRPDDIAVLNGEDEASKSFARETKAHVINYGGKRRPLELKLLAGRHNQLNAQAALAAAQAVGVPFESAQAAVVDFKGLPHRQELVHEANGVRWFNDSIATIPEAAMAALESFPSRRVIQIVGGSDKRLPMNAMCDALAERAKVVLCIGQTGPMIGKMISDVPRDVCVPLYQCGDLATAVKMARSIAVSGDVVLLSTGFASFDQFENFEKRGEAFARLAKDASAGNPKSEIRNPKQIPMSQ